MTWLAAIALGWLAVLCMIVGGLVWRDRKRCNGANTPQGD
jgi:hypothetical protein